MENKNNFTQVDSNCDSENKNGNETYKPDDQSPPKTPFYQKWWFWLILIIILLSTFSRCESNQEEDKSNVGTAHVVIEDFRLSENYGDPIIIIKYQYTNYDDEPRSFRFSVSSNAYQDGIELDSAILIDDETDNHLQNKYTDVNPGVTIAVEVAYKLRNLTSDVSVVLTNFLGIGNESISRAFEIKTLAENVLGDKDTEGSIGDIYKQSGAQQGDPNADFGANGNGGADNGTYYDAGFEDKTNQ